MKVTNKIEIFNIPERVVCKECMGTYKQITEFHVRKHGLTMKQYRRKYPDAHLTCSSTLLNASNKQKKYFIEHPDAIEKFRTEQARNPIQIKKRVNKLRTLRIRKKQKKHEKLVKSTPGQKKRMSKQSNEMWSNDEFKEKMKERMSVIETASKMKEGLELARKQKIEKHKVLKQKILPKINEMRLKGYTYQKIAEKTGIGIGTIYNWFNGRTL